jgi:rhodanese-related sulfurtransferase
MTMFGHTHAPQVTADQAIAMLRDGAALIDVREADEWQAGHAPDAMHVPLGQLGATVSQMDQAQPLVIICRSGRRSDNATVALRHAGYDAYNFIGGMHAWHQAGGAVIAANGQPGTVI